MQDIVFYVAAKETRGIVRDSANANTISAPNIVLGVSVRLKMRLFAACDVSTPYPIDAFSGIVDWKWNMNVGFNRIGTVKLTSDPQSVTVHSVTDTVDGNSMSFTEFVIPISEMNTQELADWFGNEEEWAELNGELVGYNNAGDAGFVLQIKGFTIWNRIAGLGDPTVLDQEFATRSQTVQMIRDAVSSSAATKQDVLTSANAGTNISIDENGIITNTYSLPPATTASVGGITLATASETISGSNAAKAVTPASFKAALSGECQIIAHSALDAFQTITDLGAALNVSLESGGAYKLSAVAGNHYLSVPDIPVGKYGMDAHLKLFVGETAFIHVQDPLILMDALIPNAVNDCLIRFRDGEARLYVEDHDVGYVVTITSGMNGTSLSGSLYYGLTGTPDSYVVFANMLNGQTCDLGGAVTNGDKRIVGNGYTQTIISGGVSCTSKTTFSNLGMNGVSVLGGTATLGDVFIDSGSTVSVNGGSLAIEKVTGSGGVIDLNGSNRISAASTTMRISSASIENSTGDSALYITNGGSAFLDGVSFKHNTGVRGDIYMYGRYVELTGCTVNKAQGYTGEYRFVGSNVLTGTLNKSYQDAAFSVSFASGAIIDLTGNTNDPAINPGSGVTFEQGGATVYPSAGQASAYMLGGMTVPAIGNTNVVNLNGGRVTGLTSASYASNCIFSGGTAAFVLGNSATRLTLDNCTVTKNALTGTSGGIWIRPGASVTLSSCIVSGNSGNVDIFGYGESAAVVASDCTFGHISLNTGALVTLAGNNNIKIISAYGAASGTVTISSGAILDLTGNTNPTPIAPGGGITISSGGISIIDSAGTTHEFQDLAITGTTVNNLGQIFGATVSVPVSSTGVGPWIISTTLGSSTVSATAEAQELVIDGGLVSIEEL